MYWNPWQYLLRDHYSEDTTNIREVERRRFRNLFLPLFETRSAADCLPSQVFSLVRAIAEDWTTREDALKVGWSIGDVGSQAQRLPRGNNGRRRHPWLSL